MIFLKYDEDYFYDRYNFILKKTNGGTGVEK